MIDVTFGSSQINWGISMDSLSSEYILALMWNGAALSLDKSKIYVMHVLGQTSSYENSNNTSVYTYDLSIFFITLNSTSGSVIGSIYKTNNGFYAMRGAAISGDYVVAPFETFIFSSNSICLMIFNTVTSSFSFKLHLGYIILPIYHPISDK